MRGSDSEILPREETNHRLCLPWGYARIDARCQTAKYGIHVVETGLDRKRKAQTKL